MSSRFRLLLALLALGLIAAGCGDASLPELGTDPGSTTTTPPSSSTAPVETTPTTPTTPAPTTSVATTPTAPPLPDPQFTAAASPEPGVACVGTRLGLSCLVDGSWENFDGDNSPIYDWVQEVAICPDGTVVAPTLGGVATYHDGTWADVDADFASSPPNAVACGADELWAGWFGSVAVLRAGVWTSWESEAVLGGSDFVKSVDDIALAPDGSAWLVTGSSVARYQDDAWTVWEEGNGLEDRFAPDAIAVEAAADGSYVVHVAAGSTGLYHFVDGGWQIQDTFINGSDAVAAADGAVYVPAHEVGITRYEGAAATEFGPDEGLSSDDVRGVAVDAQGNVWLATAYGLTVSTADGARTYRVDNSGLLDNDTYAVAVGGSGPDLPADAPEDWATIAGVVLDETGTPHAAATVEVCVERQRDDFAGDTPCADHPYAASTTTDDDGRFEISGLRPGRYTVAMHTPTGWTYFVDGSASARYDAVSGELSELGVFTISTVPPDE